MSQKAAKKKGRAKPAAKKKAKAHLKAKEEKVEEPKPVVKIEPSPQATVLVRHERSMQERRGKGFSSGELSGAGMSMLIARSLRVPTDSRRRSTLDGNVSTLKAWYKPAPKKPSVPKTEKPKAEKPAKKKAKKSKKAEKEKKE